MATQVSNNIVRPKVDIPPGIWGDMFLDCPTKEIDTATQSRHKELREQVRKMFMYSPMDNSNQRLQLLHLIDAVQRLGIGYHFEKEIEDALKHVYHDKNIDAENDLYTTALRFRLLREHGFRVSCETFNNFKDKKGNFKSVLTSDVRGLLELYEASYMRVHGEDILDEAIAFTTAQLALAAESLDHPTNLKEKVTHALKQSLRRGIRRVEARHYISVYQDEESYNKELLEFAKIDFNMLQLLYRKELSEICRWWKDSEFTTKLPYVRDRVVECYFWVMGIDFEPHYSLGRRFLSKVIAMISVFDDTYDSYGTYDELEICTDAIERWDIKCMDQLPDYMKVSYKALLEVYQEMEEQLADQGQQYRVEYARKAMIQLAQAYLLEAKWTQENCKPTFEEFKGNALTTSSYALLSVAAFAGMGDVVTEETYKWAFTDPKIIRASKIICRFVDDITEHKFKQKRDDDFSSVELYMEEYGVSAQEAYDELNKHIESSWKDINQELLKPTEMPTPILNPCLDLARPMDALYTEGDGYTNVGRATKTGITSVLIDPVLL